MLLQVKQEVGEAQSRHPGKWHSWHWKSARSRKKLLDSLQVWQAVMLSHQRQFAIGHSMHWSLAEVGEGFTKKLLA